jgi:hypothetical protein
MAIAGLLGIQSCKKDTEKTPNNNTSAGIRPAIDYSRLTPSTPYKSLFLNKEGDSIVDLTAGNTRYKMFQALNYYLGAAIRDNKILDSTLMRSQYDNSGSPFVDITSLNILGSDLNTSTFQLRNITAFSKNNEADIARKRIDLLFGEMALLSTHVYDTAAKGKAGKVGTYLADANGIEVAQIIQKSLIGSAQLDYISNVLLGAGLDANNQTIVKGKNYTQLEQNWDEAYGFLTLNPVFLLNSTDATKGTSESFLGSYIWEFNKAAYPKFYPAFLKGRAAIANNDIPEMKSQALFIRTEMEKAIALSAIGYLNKWKSGTTDAARIHAIGEGLGFIYSLRYCNINGVDAQFSDAILLGLVGSQDGYWDLTNTKINTAIDAITLKFKL